MAKKRRKIRVDLRKNRGKRQRDGDLTRRIEQEKLDADTLAFEERVSGKGDLTRRRTVVVSDDDSSASLRDVATEGLFEGRVLRAVGANQCLVEDANGRQWNAAVRQVVRDAAIDARNVVVAGDRVRFRPVGDFDAAIERVEPRTGVLSRGSKRRQHVIVANVTQVVIVMSLVDPPLKPSLIDRLLISAEKGNARSVLCLTKVDRADDAALQPLVGRYTRLGYKVALTSAKTGYGIPYLKSLLAGEQSVVAGQSGVGKSTLLNAIHPDFNLRTNTVSDDSGKGRHTTRTALLLKLDTGWVVDTPGIRQLELWDVLPEEVEGFFIEFRPFLTYCRFPDCTHFHERDCGVKRAVASGLISRDRYDSYLAITLGDWGEE